MKKAIYFDMDGTLAGLFYVKNFKTMLDNKDATPYLQARPLYNVNAMNEQIERLKKLGYVIGIISYVDNGDFAKVARKAKREWLKKNFALADEIHIVQKRNANKSRYANIHNAILVDDAKANRQAWQWGETINAYRADLVNELKKIEA